MKKYIALMLLLPIGIVAQDRSLKRAEKNFEEQSYISAIKIYQDLAERGIGSDQIYEKLGDANYFNASYLEAEKWYSKRFELKGTFPSEFLFRYGQSLKSAGKTDLAEKVLAQYAKEYPTQIRSLKQINGKNAQAQSVKKGTDNFTISNLNINTKYSDYSSSMRGDTILFASARPRAIGNQIYARTGQPYTNLFYSVKSKRDNKYSSPDLYSKDVFSVFHEASPSFSSNGNEMYYTQNEVVGKNGGTLVDGLYKIYKSVKIKGHWNNLGVQDIFAKETARVAHPAVSSDGKTLYFASDAKGTFGQSDIFKVAINSDGTYGKPENLGNLVNTEGRETYPFVTKDNILLFASDGHPGDGGLDIFALDLNQQKAAPVHLNQPINSGFDDFGIYWDRNTNNGVFTSNRPEGKGDDDLYSFNNDKNPFAFDYDANLLGVVLDNATGLFIPEATVILFKDSKEVARTTADANGNFVFDKIEANVPYRVQASKDRYANNESLVNLPLYQRSGKTEIKLDLDKYKIEEGLDLAKVLMLRHVYFDLNKSDIREDSKVELEKIVIALKQYPKLKILIGSHTDSRQSKVYNQKLSERRAKSTLNYLVKAGIPRNSLKAKGYGETVLVNTCTDDVTCTEEEHQLNRRSTFVVLGNKQ
jgi:outer membrane protein OmpA-like peptidoglycan-associated protein